MRAATWMGAAAMVLATARISRLVTDDRITAGLRDAVERRSGPEGALTYLVNCPVCTSVWAGLAVAAVLPDRLVWGLGLSEAAILMSEV